MGLKSQYATEKGVEQILSLSLEDGEDILECIKKAASEQNLDEFRISEMKGHWKDGFMNYFQRERYKSRRSFDVERVSAGSGKFIRKGDDYEGDLHIVVAVANHRINGTVVEGKAAGGLIIKLKFIKMLG